MKINKNLILSQISVGLYVKNLDGVYLWCNDHFLQLIGNKAFYEVIGKQDSELFSAPEAQRLRLCDADIISTNKSIQVVEQLDVKQGKITLLSRKKPFIDQSGQIIGIIGNSIDITSQTQVKDFFSQQKEDANSYLSNIVELSGGSIYWKDINGKYLGCNAFAAKMAKLSSPNEIIGKTDYDLFDQNDADIFRDHDLLVMQNRQESITEENVLALDGTRIVQLSCKRPLYDKQNNVIGVIGNTIDITAQKEAEQLKLETALQKLKAQEQEAFQIIVGQVSHDIRSPLVSLQSLVQTCKYLPEPERIALRHITERIADIANNLLHNYKQFELETSVRLQQPRAVLVALVLAEILSAKRQKCINLPIKLNLIIKPECNFIFIKIDVLNFKRAIANLINNAIESCEGQIEGRIDLELSCNSEQVKIILQDNGKGMAPAVLAKIRSGISVTADKINGSGIGLTQVRSTMEANHGSMVIDSQVGVGTRITLIFTKASPPNWMARQINLHHGDIVVVLDDDDCIHDIWRKRFAKYRQVIQLKHFTCGQQAVDFINHHPKKHQIFLLSDFELIDQELNGAQVIEQTMMQKQAILVTSHHESQEVRELAIEAGLQILPKQLASAIVIEVASASMDNGAASVKKTDVVIIDDDQLLANSLANFFQNKFMRAAIYHHPDQCLKHITEYQKDTIICMDYDFKATINGLELAEKLHQLGFTKLFLFSGKQFAAEKLPGYLTVILKGCMADLHKIR